MEEPGITIYSSWRGLIAAGFSPAFLVGWGGYGVIVGGPRPFPLVLITLGALIGAVSLFDYPRKTRFTPEGVERICLLRRHRIPWKAISSLERARGSRPRRRRRFLAGDVEREPRLSTFGGLVAVSGRRRHYLLVNQCESREEYDKLIAKVGEWSPQTFIRATQPPDTAPPSDLYRRTRRP
ncbi:MAG: hypothetical protein ACE5KX_07195 [Acidimicrobiia bacterium]